MHEEAESGHVQRQPIQARKGAVGSHRRPEIWGYQGVDCVLNEMCDSAQIFRQTVGATERYQWLRFRLLGMSEPLGLPWSRWSTPYEKQHWFVYHAPLPDLGDGETDRWNARHRWLPTQSQVFFLEESLSVRRITYSPCNHWFHCARHLAYSEDGIRDISANNIIWRYLPVPFGCIMLHEWY